MRLFTVTPAQGGRAKGQKVEGGRLLIRIRLGGIKVVVANKGIFHIPMRFSKNTDNWILMYQLNFGGLVVATKWSQVSYRQFYVADKHTLICVKYSLGL